MSHQGKGPRQGGTGSSRGHDNQGRDGRRNETRGGGGVGGTQRGGDFMGGGRGFRGAPSGRGNFGGPKPYEDVQPIITYNTNRPDLRTPSDSKIKRAYETRIKKEYGTGWHDLPGDLKHVQVQKYVGSPASKCKKKIDISVNWFPLQNFKVPEQVFHYIVTMERVRESKPDPTKQEKKPAQGQDIGAGETPQQIRLPKPFPQLILQNVINDINIKNKFYGVVSDLSNNVYSTKQLENLGVDLIQTIKMKDLDQDILQEDNEGSVKVTLARTDLEVGPSSLRALNSHLAQYGSWKGFDMDVSVRTVVEQIYNAFVKSLPAYKFIPCGRSNLIRWSGEVFPLNDNVVCWKGLSANISMGWKHYLNINVEHCPFLEDKNVVEAIKTIAIEKRFNGALHDVPKWQAGFFREVLSRLKNVKVYYVVQGRKISGPISNVLKTSVGQTMFSFNGKNISVHQYFRQRYNLTVVPKGICLELRSGKSQVPAEICIIQKGQSYNRKLNEQQTSNMLKIAKKNPDVLYKEIMNQVDELYLSSPVAAEWGVNVNKEMLRLKDARVLNPPTLMYGGATGGNQGKIAAVTPQDGSWDINQVSFTFFDSVTITERGVVVANCSTQNLQDFKALLIRKGRENGVIFKNQNPIEEKIQGLYDVKDDFDKSRSNFEKIRKFFEVFKAKNTQIVFVIVPKKNCAIYNHVKQVAELNPDSKGLGLLTQCVVAANVEKGQPATINNILLKVNSKLGGKNYFLTPPAPIKDYFNLLECPTLIVGADIDGKETFVPSPSFAAVTGSVDKTGMAFMMDIKAQTKAGRGAAEVIQGLDESVIKLLKGFHLFSKGIIPRKIIYFRDGVGEGQFPELLHIELRAIRRACEKLKDFDGEPYRPKITFVAVQKRHKTRIFLGVPGGTIKNAPAGTVVDREIVHQTHNDFYLLSHKGMLGTSRPTHYRVLWDDSDFSADEIQHLTYFLCYMYVRCRKSVKIPAPTYYAHWAAARAKALADGMESKFDTPEKLTKYMMRHPDLTNNSPMHFV